VKPKALLFDFYGTIVEDADEYVVSICSEISRFSKLKVSSSEVSTYWFQIVPQMCSKYRNDNFRLLMDIGVESLHDVLQRFQCLLESREFMKRIQKYWKNPRIFPECKTVLSTRKIQEMPKCIVSNIDNLYLESALRMHDLRFEHIVTSESSKSYKPHKKIFEYALLAVGLSPEEVVHIGDSLKTDVAGARALGIPVVWVNRENKDLSSTDVMPDYTVNDLTGILDILS
jgi:2-haloacid dehalogenase/putative hydrolase of the HAD superfamily